MLRMFFSRLLTIGSWAVGWAGMVRRMDGGCESKWEQGIGNRESGIGNRELRIGRED